MDLYEKRLATFTSWPHIFPQPTDLAGAGFEYAPSQRCPDKVRCTECLQYLGDWQPDDNPLLEHIRFQPHCRLARQIADAKKQRDHLIPRSGTQETTQPAAQSTLPFRSQLPTEAPTQAMQKTWRMQSQHDSSKKCKQQSKASLQQQKQSKRDQQQQADSQQMTAQDPKQEQKDNPVSKDAQTTAISAVTSSGSPKSSLATSTPVVTPSSVAAAEITTSNRPFTSLPGFSLPSCNYISNPSCDERAEKASAKADLSGESMEKVVLDVGDWVELGFDGEEQDDWVKV